MRVCVIFIVSGFCSGHFCSQTDVLLVIFFFFKESLTYHTYYIYNDMSLNWKISKGALRNTAIANMLNNSERVLYTLRQKKTISVSNIYAHWPSVFENYYYL